MGSRLTSSEETSTSFSITAPETLKHVVANEDPSQGVKLQLTWKLDFGRFTKDDFVYTLNHQYVRVGGGERMGMNHISQEYPTECQPTSKFGPVQCGLRNSQFANRIIMYMSTITAHESSYDTLVVSIDSVTLSDFNVDPDRKKNDVLAEKMKFEATMHCAVLEHIGEKSSSTIDVAYTKEKQNIN